MTLALPGSPARRRRLPRTGLGAAFQVLVVFAIALATGLGATWLCVVNGVGFGEVRSGPWLARPRLGSMEADPYSRALVARSGDLPLGLGEGLTFVARRDSSNVPLVGSCSYRIVGRAPPTRYWTVTLHNLDGSIPSNKAGRFGFTSGEVVREEDGRFDIAVAGEAQPGNWLPLGGPGRFEVALRLYDTPVSATVSVIDPALLPRIEREACP
jgi:hypothetical protein